MTTLSTGVLLKLHDGMKTGAAKPVGEHRTAVLQVTDIVPAVMGEKDLFPRHGQFYKVSDSSHSIYATLPPVLNKRLQLGQFVHVDRLDPGSRVPVIVGAKPLPGCHPLVVGTSKPGKKAAPTRGPKNHAAGVLASSKVVRSTALNFEDTTSVKERPNCAPPPARSSASAVRKSTSVMPRLVSSNRSFAADRGDPPPSKIPRRPLPAEKCSMSCTASRATSKKRPSSSTVRVRVPVPAKLNAIGKEALEQREQARKAALEARDTASATENVFRIWKMFSDVSKTATADAPAACFDGFLSFHKEAVRAVADMESIQAATSMAATATTDPAPRNVLQEIAQNRPATARRRGLLGLGGVSKSASLAPGLNASRKCLAAADKPNDKRSSAPAGPVAAQSPLGSSLRMAKQMQAEAGSWFMEFLEAALETGLKKSGGGQSLMMGVANWVEMEQIGGGESRKVGHPRAAAIARKLKIKAKNPC